MKVFTTRIPVSVSLLAALLFPVGIAMVTLAGCGGGVGNSSAPIVPGVSRAARATVRVAWPARTESRLVPVASNSIRITITNSAGFSASQVIARPATEASFADLPPGALMVHVTAHADSAGDAQPAQASGDQVVTVVAEETFALNLTMGSTIDRLALTQTAPFIGVGEAATFAVSAQDVSGSLVLTGGTTWRWASDASSVVTGVATGAGFVVSALAPGNATITVTETESGKTATLPLVVTSAATPSPSPSPTPDPFAGVREYTNLDLDNLFNYVNPAYPVHYDAAARGQDNTPPDNMATNRGATLGRVLFHDKRLSVNDTVACASCHQQGNGFTDNRRFSAGFNGAAFTTAHSMRLNNIRFYGGQTMFWDKRAASVEEQAAQPIQNPVEMGFDAAHGGIGAVLGKMATLPYYPELFRWVYGDSAITEERVEKALAQYERSIVSVNSRFDTEFARVFDPSAPGRGIGVRFAGYTTQEERGKQLFIGGPGQGGAGCVSCHQAPSFALDRNSRSNGLDGGETRVFKAPSLKNVALTGPYMHDGRFATLEQVVDHYIRGVQNGPALDNRLKNGAGQPQRLPLTVADRDALVAFMRTLNDPTLGNDPKFANPLMK